MMHDPISPVGDRHAPDCDCLLCRTFRPAPSDRLTATHMGWLALGGAAFGHVLAAAIVGPAAVADALLTAIGWR